MTWEDVAEFTERYRLRPISCAIFCLFLGMLFVATHWPQAPHVDLAGFRPSDKVQHFVGYSILGVLLLTTLKISKWSVPTQLRRFHLLNAVVVVIVVMIGSVDELTQPWFGRTCSAYDLLADVVGVLFAVFVVTLAELTLSLGRRYRFSRYEPLKF